jgi:hypothetical protein
MNPIYMKTLYIAISVVIILLSSCNSFPDKKSTSVDHQPVIFPDYEGVVLPPNIAPINFTIQQKGDVYYVKISSTYGDAIVINNNQSGIRIPERKWHKLLNENKGNPLTIDVIIKDGNNLHHFQPITDTIAKEAIDSYLAYRKIIYTFYYSMDIVQRNVENFDENYIFRNKSADMLCVNCHSFCKNDPNKMSLHLRRFHAGTIIINGDTVKKIDTKTPNVTSPGVYTSWHPNGRFIAYSNNDVRHLFSSYKNTPIVAYDKFSDIMLYDVEKNITYNIPALSTPNLENLPNWSPDGKYLYFISSDKTGKGDNEDMGKYSLCRIPFDAVKIKWGPVDTLISAKKSGISVSHAKPSPDGRYLIFSASNKGYFAAFDSGSDLYQLDLQTMKYSKIPYNSPCSESYISWSNNGNWFVFASKRMDNFYTRPYFAYFDTQGRMHKPFVLPQNDPAFYQACPYTFNLPELISGKVRLNENQFRDIAYKDAIPSKPGSASIIDASAGATQAVDGTSGATSGKSLN